MTLARVLWNASLDPRYRLTPHASMHQEDNNGSVASATKDPVLLVVELTEGRRLRLNNNSFSLSCVVVFTDVDGTSHSMFHAA
jgi:hypothetical protein